MLGSVLPDLRAAYALDYQIGGTLLSAQSIGYLGIGLLSGLAAIKWGLKRAYLILYYVFAVGFVMLLTNGSPVWLLAAMFLTGISKGAITDYNNRVMSEYANGIATPLNMMHAAMHLVRAWRRWPYSPAISWAVTTAGVLHSRFPLCC